MSVWTAQALFGPLVDLLSHLQALPCVPEQLTPSSLERTPPPQAKPTRARSVPLPSPALLTCPLLSLRLAPLVWLHPAHRVLARVSLSGWPQSIGRPHGLSSLPRSGDCGCWVVRGYAVPSREATQMNTHLSQGHRMQKTPSLCWKTPRCLLCCRMRWDDGRRVGVG